MYFATSEPPVTAAATRPGAGAPQIRPGADAPRLPPGRRSPAARRRWSLPLVPPDCPRLRSHPLAANVMYTHDGNRWHTRDFDRICEPPRGALSPPTAGCTRSPAPAWLVARPPARARGAPVACGHAIASAAATLEAAASSQAAVRPAFPWMRTCAAAHRPRARPASANNPIPQPSACWAPRSATLSAGGSGDRAGQTREARCGSPSFQRQIAATVCSVDAERQFGALVRLARTAAAAAAAPCGRVPVLRLARESLLPELVF